jgi:predicted nucleic acid-binding protein
MVVADTDIIIAAIRGNEMAKQLLIKHHPNIYISVITEMELTIGATNPTRKNTVKEVLKNHDVIYINKAICETALQLVATYNTVSRSLYLVNPQKNTQSRTINTIS